MARHFLNHQKFTERTLHHLSVRTLQKWEQGKCNTDGAAHALLRVMEREPDAVLLALHDT